MKNPKIKYLSETDGLFQQITGYFYLIPNIKKCLKRILQTINYELSLPASIIYYNPPSGKKIVVKKYSLNDKKFPDGKFSAISEIIFKENYPNIRLTKRIHLNIGLEACIIPIRCESNLLGIMILFDDNKSLSQDNIIEESIGTYVTAACIGNQLIASKENILYDCFGFNVNHEISIKKLIEWRMQEIISNFSTLLPTEQHIYQEISRETEKTLIMTALKESNNNQTQAAKYLGINRNTLRKKIKDLNIDKLVKSH